MKPTQFFALSLTSLLAVGAIAACSTPQPPVAVQQEPSVAASPKSQPSNILSTGSFVKAEQPTQGGVRIITENGKNYLEVAENFKTSDQGPDLQVILYRTANPPESGIKESDYVILGKLQKFSGAQRYEIASNVNVKDFGSAAIWCRKFNATFGYAKLG
ncbi:DM13 domain-containing protein [Tumidithrix helvetica PCC 7403]|uniref:DM13 domain-containing protein n=1 Tax=Tumidithrix helvetica TaxID=3457545 RepID=UPI003CB2C78D